jgi:hypothetical protein
MAWWCENVTQRVLNDGVENLTVDNETGSTLGYGLVQFSGAAQSWMKNVRQINGPQAQVFIYGSANIEIRDSYFYGTINPDGCGVASTQYGIDPANAGLVKVENNIFQQGCSAFQAQPCYVCVFAYNFSVGDLNQMLDQGGGSLAPYVFWAGGPGHVGGTHLLLWEGNELNAFATDHGVSHGTNAMFLTAFRNRFSGVQPTNPISTAQTPNPRNPVHNQAYNRFNNYIGNVLGDPSLAAAGWTYQTYPGFGSDPVATSATGTIFAIGWAVNGTPDDLTTHTSLMRWGNFDYVTNAVRWCGDSGSPGWSTTCNSVTEIPADTVVPSSTTLPASLYLAGKPAWFGNQTWPVIGPDVMSGSDRAGHAGDIPAKRCYLNVMGGPLDGSGPVLAFNASNC